MRNALHSTKTSLGGEARPQTHSNAKSVNAIPIRTAVTSTLQYTPSLTTPAGVCAWIVCITQWVYNADPVETPSIRMLLNPLMMLMCVWNVLVT